MNLPNRLTLLRIILIPVFIALVMLDSIPFNVLWALLVFIIASLTDLLDGKIARRYSIETEFGRLMDPLADKILVCSALIMLLGLGQVSTVAVVTVIAREFLVNSLRMLALEKQRNIAVDRWGKLKTATQMVFISVALLNRGLPSAPLWLSVASIFLMWLMVFFTVFSCVRYIILNRGIFTDETTD